MDGLAQISIMDAPECSEAFSQRTLRTAIGCVGAGLHTGQRVSVTLRPAPVGAGIKFVRTDLGVSIPATFDRVADTRLCTVLASADRPDVRVGTVEHIMAALAGLGIHNATVELDGPEAPILDGSAAPWVFLLDCAGTVAQAAPARVVEVLRTVRVGTDTAFAELRPAGALGHDGLDLSVAIDFAAPAIGRQALTVPLTTDSFRGVLQSARTFTEAHEVAGLRAAGLALGGSLDNAVVVDGDRVLNPGGLRMADEFVRHKALDAAGDLALAGAMLRGRFVGCRSGHALNNQVLHALFADAANWRDATQAGRATRAVFGTALRAA